MAKPIKVVSIIAARLDSTRLPGKVLRPLNGVPLLKHVIYRALKIRRSFETVVATTTREVDLPVVTVALEEKVSVFRGDMYNVASRFLNCAKMHNADYFVRINGDSPFIDPNLIDHGIERAIEDRADYVTNLLGRTFPYGVSVEVVSTEALENAVKSGLSDYEQEHLTSVFGNYPDRFKISSFLSSNPEFSAARLTVDTEEDLVRLGRVASNLGEPFSCNSFEKISQAYLLDNY